MKIPEKIEKPLLLHVCCAPCASVPFEDLARALDYGATGFFYNPNIHPDDEFDKRKFEVERLAGESGFPCVFTRPDYQAFLEFVRGLESEPEGGKRCMKCFEMRLSATFKYAEEKGFAFVGTTLSSSPHKNVASINLIGNNFEKDHPGIRFLEFDFKKRDGFKRGIEICKRFSIYRQRFCGCGFSKNN